MAKVKNALRQPLDIEIVGKGGNIALGPRGVSRDLSKQEMDSPQIKANIKAGLIIVLEDAAAAPTPTPAPKEGGTSNA